MDEFQITPQTLVTVMIASGLAVLISTGTFGFVTTATGLTMLLILFAYDNGTTRSFIQSVAFSAVAATELTIAVGILVQKLASTENVKPALAVIWIGAVVLATVIDQVRTGSRAQAPLMQSTAPRQTTSYSEAAKPPRHSPTYGLTAAPATDISGAWQQAEPVTAEPYREDPIASGPQIATEVPTEQTPPAFNIPPPPPPAPAPVVAAPIVTTTIHVYMIGQGITLLRPVQAEHLARDIYRIVEPMPDGERWKYETGQAVRCKKQKLSSGKALVAYEEVILQRVG